MKNKIWTCLIILTIAAVNVSCNSETECKHIDSQVTSKEAQSKDFQSENSEKNVEDTEEYSGSDNPIDKYFTPKLKSLDISEVELRENREAYKKAWKAEYKNVMKSLKKKCVYAEDKRNINSLEKNIEQQIKVEKKVLKTELTEASEDFLIRGNTEYPDYADSSAWLIGKARYKDKDEEKASAYEAELYGKGKKIDFRDVSISAINEIKAVISQMEEVLRKRE